MKLFSKILGALLATSLLSLPAEAVTREEATLEQSLLVLRELQAIPTPASRTCCCPGPRASSSCRPM